MAFNIPIFVASIVAGAALGTFYLYALRLSVERLKQSAHPQRSLLAGMAIRLLSALCVLFLAAQFGAEALAGGLIGFLLARGLVLRRVRRELSAN